MCLGNYYQRAKLEKIMKMYKLSSKKNVFLKRNDFLLRNNPESILNQ